MKLSSCLLACAGFLSIASAHSFPGNRPGLLTFTAGGGYVYLASNRHMDNQSAGMIALGYDVTEHWGIESMLASFSTHFKKNTDDHRHVSGTFFAIDGVYHFMPEHSFQPYVLAGPGITGLSPNGYDSSNSGNFNFALGAQYFINKTFSLRAEARDLYTWVGGKHDVFLNAGISASFDFC